MLGKVRVGDEGRDGRDNCERDGGGQPRRYVEECACTKAISPVAKSLQLYLFSPAVACSARLTDFEICTAATGKTKSVAGAKTMSGKRNRQ